MESGKAVLTSGAYRSRVPLRGGKRKLDVPVPQTRQRSTGKRLETHGVVLAVAARDAHARYCSAQHTGPLLADVLLELLG